MRRRRLWRATFWQALHTLVAALCWSVGTSTTKRANNDHKIFSGGGAGAEAGSSVMKHPECADFPDCLETASTTRQWDVAYEIPSIPLVNPQGHGSHIKTETSLLYRPHIASCAPLACPAILNNDGRLSNTELAAME